MAVTGRLILYDSYETPLGDLPRDVLAALPREVEEVNGEHTLTITTKEPCALLQKGTRVLNQDGTGKWREWVVDEPHEVHGLSEYLCVWSLQHDTELADTDERWASAEEGAHTPISASDALAIALADCSRWGVGSVTVATTAACSLYDQQVWDNVKKIVDTFGGELDAEITVGETGVLSRNVALLAHVGTTRVTRRFEYGHDLIGIDRTEEPGPRWCGIRPRGGSSKTDNDGVDYSMRIGVEAYLGTPYIYDDEVDPETGVSVKELNKVPDGHGGWLYPCKTVIYDQDVEGVTDQYALAQELYEMAAPDLFLYTRPAVSYSADVLQLARGGLDPKGVCCGDEVHIVDRTFAGGRGLRVPGRVLRIEQDLPVGGAEPNGPAQLTLGQIGYSLGDRMRELASAVAGDVAGRLGSKVAEITQGGTLVYIDELLEQVNAQLNAGTSYVYIVNGETGAINPSSGGIFTYDVPVSDPLRGTGAHRVVKISAGGIQFANSRDSAGNWLFKNVITADGYIALAATIARITAGYIKDANENVVINLDGGTVTFKRGLIQTADGLSQWNLNTGVLKSYGTAAGAEFGKYKKITYNTLWERTNLSSMPMNDPYYDYMSRNHVIYRASKTANHATEYLYESKMYLADGAVRLEKYDTRDDITCYTETPNGDGDLVVSYTGGNKLLSRMIVDEGWSYETDLGKMIDLTVSRDEATTKEAEDRSAWYDSHDYPSFRLYARHSSGGNPYPSSKGFAIDIGGNGGILYPEASIHADGPMYVQGGGLWTGTLKYEHYISIGSMSGTNVVVVRDLMQQSDRRLKEHLTYLADDAAEFVRRLRPALFVMNGLRHTGFYAQDVADAEPDTWESSTVREGADEGGALGYDPLLLDYQALIAPLVAYAQALERRIDQQEQAISELTGRIEALEGKRGLA